MIFVQTLFLLVDAILAFNFGGRFGVGLGTALMAVNFVLLAGYTYGCHALRHLAGGGLDCFSCSAAARARFRLWKGVTILNQRHERWAWASLFSVWGVAERWVLVWTSVAFAAWHISTALLPTDFRPPLVQVPIYILNAAVIGFIWALMRKWSGSIVVTSASHAVCNSLAYVLFGVGSTLGALGIHNTAVFGPEVGLVGLGLNLAFAAVLWLGFGRGTTVKVVEMARP